MSFEVTGKLIQKYPTQNVNERFRKREFVLELEDNVNGNVYTNFAKMQLVQAKCDLLDRYNEGDIVKVNFNIKGNRWERDGEVRYITSLDAWRLENGTLEAAQAGGENYNQGGYNSGGGQGGGYNNSGGANANRGNNGGSGYNNGGGSGYNQGGANNNANANSGGASNASFGAGGGNAAADGNVDDLPF